MSKIKNKEIYCDLPLIITKPTIEESFRLLEAPTVSKSVEKPPAARRAGAGRLSKIAKDISSLAKDNPDELLDRMGILYYEPVGKKNKIVEGLFNKIITSKIDDESYFQYIFDRATIMSNGVAIKIAVYSCEDDEKIQSVSDRTAAAIVKSIIYAAATSEEHKKIDWDERDDITYSNKEKIIYVSLNS